VTADTNYSICWVCSGGDFRSVCEKDGHRYVQCARCGVVRQYPYPNDKEIAQYYERYMSHKTASSIYLSDDGFEPFRRDKLLTFGDLGVPLDKFQGKHVCDVGCATGQFLQMMAEYGPARLFGIDASKECVDIGKSRGLDCEQGDFLRMSCETFDVITMWHLVEHLPKPQEFIRHAHDLLSPGGWLFIETPVIGAVSESFGAHWRYFSPIEHINLFPMDALVRVCCDAGFSLRSYIRFGSGNDSENVPAQNKSAMDTIAKKSGFGDTIALWLTKNDCLL
jgi:SAM-dependent methyltransferase